MCTFLRRLILLLLLPVSVYAADTGLSGTNLEFFHPAIDSSGFFGVNGPRLLPPGQLYLKISQSYAGDRLFEIAVNNVPVDLVDKIATTSVVASIGINPFLTLGVEAPFSPYAREADFNALVPFTTQAIGDPRLAFKFRLLEEKAHRPGLALLFTNSFPVGAENKFLGDSHMVPGADLIVGKEFQDFSFAINAGGRFPQGKDILGLKFDDTFNYGGGIRVPVSFLDPLFSVAGEVRGSFQMNKVQVATAPMEFTAGVEKRFHTGWSIAAGGGGAWNNAIGNPRMRGIFTVSWTPSLVHPPRPQQEQKPPETLPETNPQIQLPETQPETRPETAPATLQESAFNGSLLGQIHTTLYFKYGHRRPDRESIGWIHELAKRLKEHPEIKTISVEGYTDSRGNRRANLRLSRLRARVVKRLLVRDGVSPARIKTKGLDGGQPIAPNETAEGRRLNRRVEIVPLP